MGRRGPQPEPVAAKLARGETRPSRINYDQPIPQQRAPVLPADMDDAAKVVWRRTLAAMKGSGVILAADTDVLRVYCETVSRYQKVARQLASSTPLLTTSRRRGEVTRNPLHAIARDLADMIRMYARELGLSPSARASLRVDMSIPMADMDSIIGPPPRALRLVASAE